VPSTLQWYWAKSRPGNRVRVQLPLRALKKLYG